MLKQKIKNIIYIKKIHSIFFVFVQLNSFDVNIVGLLGTETTMPLISTIITDILHKKISINFLNSRSIKSPFVSIYKKNFPFNLNKIKINKKKLAPISLLTDIIGYKDDEQYYKNVPNTLIKLAYTMIETSKLPTKWVYALNNYFDAAIVPHSALRKIYRDSGVNIPIFVLPLPIYLEPLIAKPIKQTKNNPFVFGITAGFSERKNYDILIKAFYNKFANNRNVILKIHGSWGDKTDLENKIKSLNLNNVILLNQVLNRREYIKFIESCDCYIFPSKGEGFSITPREALALGIPCILSGIPVHKDLEPLKNTITVPIKIFEKAYFKECEEFCGYYHQMEVSDLENTMEKMYDNYKIYLKNNVEGRTYVSKYLKRNLHKKYRSLIKPNQIILGDRNRILNDRLITDSKSLYNKYLSIRK